MEPENTDNIVLLPNADKELEIRLKPPAAYPCSTKHRNVTVDPERRILECRDCGFVVDPFDYVNMWAADGQRRMTGLDSLKAKTKIATAEYDDLLRKITNLRAQLKRAGQPQPIQERRDWENKRLNAR